MRAWEKILNNNFIKHDMFSDLRNSVYSRIGLSQDQLNLGQQVIDTTKSVLPAGGVIPPNVQGKNGAIPLSTAPTFLSQIMGPKIAGIPIIPVVVMGLIVIIAVRK